MKVHNRSAADDCPQEYALSLCVVCGEPNLFCRQKVELQLDLLEADLPAFTGCIRATLRRHSDQLNVGKVRRRAPRRSGILSPVLGNFIRHHDFDVSGGRRE